MKLKKSIFLVTGGASNGYGRATVEKLLKEGASVIICDLPTKDLIIYGDDKAIFLPIDTEKDEDVKTLLAVIKDKYGKIDGLINCIDSYKSIPVWNVKEKEPHSLKEFAKIIYENILGPFNIIRFIVPVLAQNIPKKGTGRGIIINMSSSAAFEADQGLSAYSASKAAIIRMTEALSYELQGMQIRCVSVISKMLKNGDTAGSDECRKFAEMIKTIIEVPAIGGSPAVELS